MCRWQQLVCDRCGDVHDWRRSSRILSLRHGLESSEVALYSTFPMPRGEVETFTTMRPTTNLMGCNDPCREGESRNEHDVDASYNMLGSLSHFINKDICTGKGVDGRRLEEVPSTKGGARVHSLFKKNVLEPGDCGKQCIQPEKVLAIKEPEWTVLMQIIQDNLNDIPSTASRGTKGADGNRMFARTTRRSKQQRLLAN